MEELRRQRDDAQIQLEELRQKLQGEQQQNKVSKSTSLSIYCTNKYIHKCWLKLKLNLLLYLRA